MNNVQISVVAPAFNEEKTIVEFISTVSRKLTELNLNYEILIVDDGSNDKTWLQVKTLSKDNLSIKGIRFSKNFGQHSAISAGLKFCRGEKVIVMDSDFQDDPNIINKLILESNEGYDIVIVKRIGRNEGLIYRIVQKIFYIILNFFSGVEFDSRQANFSIFNKRVLNEINKLEDVGRYFPADIELMGFSKSYIYAKQGLRVSGKSAYNFKKRAKLAIDTILTYSLRPLYVSIILGLVIMFVSFVGVGWVFVLKFIYGFTVEGWTSLILTLFMFGGTIILLLGVLSLYVAKIYLQVKFRPTYIISEECNT